jgi:CubicO group peptidase (beta-lactamase class C family)
VIKILKSNIKIIGFGLLAWTFALMGWTLFQVFKPPVAAANDTTAFSRYIIEKMNKKTIGSSAFTLVCGGKICADHYVSRGKQVGGDTPYQVASLSKWITAWGVMTLVQSGKVDLDASISTYVKSWQLPFGDFDPKEVTVRRVLGHNAGLDDGLGYGGFLRREGVQSLPASLTHANDAIIGRSGDVRVGKKPGSGFMYSGGGFTLLQMLIEDVSGETFDAYMRRAVLVPLGMTNSAYVLTPAEESRISQSFETSGKLAPPRYYTALGAASLFTTTHDLVKFLNANSNLLSGAPQPVSPLTAPVVRSMQKPNTTMFDIPMWGLGIVLYEFDILNGRPVVMGHDGYNFPALKTTMRVNPTTGDGVIFLSSGQPELSNEVAEAWTKWQIGRTSKLDALNGLQSAVTTWGIGAFAIVILIFGAGFLRVRYFDKKAKARAA